MKYSILPKVNRLLLSYVVLALVLTLTFSLSKEMETITRMLLVKQMFLT